MGGRAHQLLRDRIFAGRRAIDAVRQKLGSQDEAGRRPRCCAKQDIGSQIANKVGTVATSMPAASALYEVRRDTALRRAGYRVLRFATEEVKGGLPRVLGLVRAEVHRLSG